MIMDYLFTHNLWHCKAVCVPRYVFPKGGITIISTEILNVLR